MAAFPFRFCPSCGEEGIEFLSGREFRCPGCGFAYFHNVASAVGAVILHRGSILCLVRAKDPGRGKIGLPGGFVDPGEAAEEALRRECREEVGLEIADIGLIGGYPNLYEYSGVPYRTCDFFFAASAAPGSALDASGYPAVAADPEEVLATRWTEAGGLMPEEFAFPSMRRAMLDWKAKRR
jgi:NAD+ diphosphatase